MWGGTKPGASSFTTPSSVTSASPYDVMELSADTGLSLTAYTAEPGSASDDALKLLASWAATLDRTDDVHSEGRVV
jgi:hypothetical protein